LVAIWFFYLDTKSRSRSLGRSRNYGIGTVLDTRIRSLAGLFWPFFQTAHDVMMQTCYDPLGNLLSFLVFVLLALRYLVSRLDYGFGGCVLFVLDSLGSGIKY
jgi:hypothetical protein